MLRVFSQQFELDYHGTFAPTATLNVVRVLMAITNDRYLHLHSIDVETAFLHAPLEWECYISIPQEAVPPRGGGMDFVLLKKTPGVDHYLLALVVRAWFWATPHGHLGFHPW